MRLLLTTICILVTSVAFAQEQVTIFAAASLTNAVGELAKSYETKTGVKIVTNFAASSVLAKQIENGAPADLFFSADTKWMDYLDAKKQIDASSRVEVLGNALVLIAPKGKTFPVRMEKDFNFAGAFTGRLAIGDPSNVPIGIYGKEAFTKLGWWKDLESRLAPAADVRAALRLVETNEVDAGLVYSTDAAQSQKVSILATIPAELHTPVRYPLALTKSANAQAKLFHAALSGPEAVATYTKFGFTVLSETPRSATKAVGK